MGTAAVAGEGARATTTASAARIAMDRRRGLSRGFMGAPSRAGLWPGRYRRLRGCGTPTLWSTRSPGTRSVERCPGRPDGVSGSVRDRVSVPVGDPPLPVLEAVHLRRPQGVGPRLAVDRDGGV